VTDESKTVRKGGHRQRRDVPPRFHDKASCRLVWLQAVLTQFRPSYTIHPPFYVCRCQPP
jgi:hypothetical protein